jgi:hypothetical protein
MKHPFSGITISSVLLIMRASAGHTADYGSVALFVFGARTSLKMHKPEQDMVE